MAKHRNSPHLAFWKMLKKGNDHFEVTRLEPRVNVCEKRYVFDAQSPGDPSRPLSFSAQAKCPAYEVDAEIATAVQKKQQRDDARFADLVRRNVAAAPVKTDADGGMHPVFVAAVKRNQIGVAPSESFLSSTPPGTIPPTVRPPRIPELADAPAVAGVSPAAHPSGEVAPQQMAIAEPGSTATQTTAKPTSFFSSLFASKTETKAAETKPAEKKSDGAIDRMARLIGLRKDEAKPDAAKPDAAKTKPAATAARPAPATANGAIRPKPADTSVRTAEAQGQAPAPAAAAPSASNPFPPPPAPQRTPAPANGGGLNGAAPVVPSGGFDSRWSAFR